MIDENDLILANNNKHIRFYHFPVGIKTIDYRLISLLVTKLTCYF
jgi:hypothetical protein